MIFTGNTCSHAHLLQYRADCTGKGRYVSQIDPQVPMDMQAFVVLYLMVLSLLVLNFLLAIIVEAYMRIRE